MSHLIDWFFAEYENVSPILIGLELAGISLGLVRAWISKQNNIMVYPTGILSTAIFVYLLSVYGLLGDLVISAYYFSMCFYVWWVLSRNVDDDHYTPLTTV